MRLVITGGHHTPALAVIEALRDRSEGLEFHWVGHKHSMWGDASPSLEYQTVTALNIPFYNLQAGRFYRIRDPRRLFRIPLGFVQAWRYLREIKPDLIVSFGGYLAVPVVIVGWLMGIPAVTHEQTLVAGWANRLISRFAKKVFISWPESAQWFPESKTILTGNPLRPEIFQTDPKFQGQLRKQFSSDRPTIYITGGKQGSHAINQVVAKALPQLLEKFNVIHQCGASSLHNDFEELQGLEKGPARPYVVRPFFSAAEVGTILAEADFVVSRSGANIISELAAVGKPAILIPLPGSSHQEQEKNAEWLAEHGGAIVLSQEDLTAEALLAECEKMTAHLEEYAAQAQRAKSSILPDAATRIAEEIVKWVRPYVLGGLWG